MDIAKFDVLFKSLFAMANRCRKYKVVRRELQAAAIVAQLKMHKTRKK